MLTAYLNYPNPHVTIHTNNGCATIQQQHKQNQRVIRLNQKTLSAELERFENKYYRFGADQETNDIFSCDSVPSINPPPNISHTLS